MLSVAEFVENEEQAALLHLELGCDVFQGYLYPASRSCLRIASQFIQKDEEQRERCA